MKSIINNTEQMALPIECPECGMDRIVNCACDWKVEDSHLKKEKSFRTLERFLVPGKVVKETQVLPGIKGIVYKN